MIGGQLAMINLSSREAGSEFFGLLCSCITIALPQLIFDGALAYVDDWALNTIGAAAVPILTTLAAIGTLYYVAWRIRVLAGR